MARVSDSFEHFNKSFRARSARFSSYVDRTRSVTFSRGRCSILALWLGLPQHGDYWDWFSESF